MRKKIDRANSIFTTVEVELQQASNSPSSECKEFIIQPKSSPFDFTCCDNKFFSSPDTYI